MLSTPAPPPLSLHESLSEPLPPVHSLLLTSLAKSGTLHSPSESSLDWSSSEPLSCGPHGAAAAEEEDGLAAEEEDGRRRPDDAGGV